MMGAGPDRSALVAAEDLPASASVLRVAGVSVTAMRASRPSVRIATLGWRFMTISLFGPAFFEPLPRGLAKWLRLAPPLRCISQAGVRWLTSPEKITAVWKSGRRLPRRRHDHPAEQHLAVTAPAHRQGERRLHLRAGGKPG